MKINRNKFDDPITLKSIPLSIHNFKGCFHLNRFRLNLCYFASSHPFKLAAKEVMPVESSCVWPYNIHIHISDGKVQHI